MSYRAWLLVIGVASLAGCGGDGDHDGLSSKDEKDLGLDPKNADSDGDGLDDGAEVAAGSDGLNADTDGDGLTDGEEVNEYKTDPTLVDTDGDTYRDSDEVTEGSDPIDPDDRIYEGYWPYYPGKDGIKQNTITDYPSDVAKQGKQFGRWSGKDQFGDMVDFYDFYNDSDIPVMLDVSAEWCPPCNSLADFMASQGTGNDWEWVGNDIDCGHKLRTAVKNGTLRWVTSLEEDVNGGPADGGPNGASGRWYDAHTDENIPVMAEGDEDLVYYMNLNYFPSLVYLNSHLELQAYDTANYNIAFDAACADLPD